MNFKKKNYKNRSKRIIQLLEWYETVNNSDIFLDLHHCLIQYLFLIYSLLMKEEWLKEKWLKE